MAITTSSGIDNKSLLPTTADTQNLPATTTTSTDKLADAQKANLLTEAGAKAQLNVSIVKASLEVSINSQNDPLALVYKSAIENLNDVLRPELGDNAIQAASSQDNSPEATAGRIVDFITNMFGLFKQNNANKDDGTNVDDYMSLVLKGVEQGFKEARGILDGLKVLNGDIASNIDKTYDLVQKSLADFVAKIKGGGSDTEGSGTGTDGDGSSASATQTSVDISISVSQTRISTTA
ncbi:DUF5610 domain-containing protein [Herbaspirillum sp. alder98]|uniref:DUF5610 domain-containing protein n=1 Tax=Herbaspirillum sp. alder98 TaxID=2913096 RepID=UPI001CD85BC7|nr:DUF5610 domain-containing protein [Herbaspirillum sp. alder98]MCA1324201.1 DUF5610 domain-containing protein [Herbaspirillum sp. alder98]